MQDNLLLSIEKPVRYLGGEMGTFPKKDAELRFVLAFPDVYEVGMSHLGFQILYAILNGLDWVAAERLYSPWPDMEASIRSTHSTVTTLESGIAPARADILGFTLQYELSYTNILTILELSGIPLLACERDEKWPLVIGGGPCAYNPEPLADFFDAFLIGDGEDAVVEIAAAYRAWKVAGTPKAQLLEMLSAIEGVYIPSFFDVRYDSEGRVAAILPLHQGYVKVRRRFLADLNTAPYPTAPVIPFLKTVHDRVSMEIARGCTRGCRFCQAGYVYRPVRERTPEQVLDLVEQTLRNTGYDEISLLSLSTGDYGCIAPLLKVLMARYAEERIAVSFPSLRVGTLNTELVDEIKKVRKTGFTLAPEAGSERLRQVINKGILEQDLLSNAFGVYSAGWRMIKLYFMIGLPGETEEDVLGIAELARKVKLEGRRAGQGGDVNVSVGNFVPKPHTPFQWEPQIGTEEIRQKQQYLRQELRVRKLKLRWQDAPTSFMEGVFARGDRRLGALLLKAQELGCRFDGWGELFDFSAWQQAFIATSIDPLFYHRRRELSEVLPWDHLDCGVSRDFLLDERNRAFACAATGDCRTGICEGCGVCDFERVKMVLSPPEETPGTSAVKGETAGAEEPDARVRIRFSKTGAMRFLSHLELLNLFIRAVGRARIPIRFSQGFHPHPKFSFATALSVGIESWAEYLDMEIAAGYGSERVKDRLNTVLPVGMEIMEAHEIPLRAASLSVIIDAVRYRVTLPVPSGLDLPHAAEKFMELEAFPYRRDKKGKVQDFDLRHELVDLTAQGNTLEMVIRKGKPLEFVSAITGLAPAELANARIEKLAIIFYD